MAQHHKSISIPHDLYEDLDHLRLPGQSFAGYIKTQTDNRFTIHPAGDTMLIPVDRELIDMLTDEQHDNETFTDTVKRIIREYRRLI